MGRVAAEGQHDFAAFGAVELLRLEALDEGDGLVEAVIELGEGLFRILVARHFGAGQAPGHTLGRVGGDLHLTHEGEHVERQAGIQHYRFVDAFFLGPGFRLFDQAAQVAENAQAAGDGGMEHVITGQCFGRHGETSLCRSGSKGCPPTLVFGDLRHIGASSTPRKSQLHLYKIHSSWKRPEKVQSALEIGFVIAIVTVSFNLHCET